MNDIVLPVEDLSAKAFAEFGDVIEVNGSGTEINQGTCRRFHDLARIDVAENHGIPLINIFRSSPRAKPIQIELLERHPLSSQAFFPLENSAWLCVVAPSSSEPEVNKIRAFLASGKQGVNYHRGVWHHPLMVLREEADFVVIDRGGEGENCDEFYFPRDQRIVLDY